MEQKGISSFWGQAWGHKINRNRFSSALGRKWVGGELIQEALKNIKAKCRVD
jgi:hypothetical protein